MKTVCCYNMQLPRTTVITTNYQIGCIDEDPVVVIHYSTVQY